MFYQPGLAVGSSLCEYDARADPVKVEFQPLAPAKLLLGSRLLCLGTIQQQKSSSASARDLHLLAPHAFSPIENWAEHRSPISSQPSVHSRLSASVFGARRQKN